MPFLQSVGQDSAIPKYGQDSPKSVAQTLQSLGYTLLPSNPMTQSTNNPQSVGHEDTIIGGGLKVGGSVGVGTDVTVQNDITAGHDVIAARNLTCGNQFITKDELVTDVLQVTNLTPRPGDTGIVVSGNLTVLPQVGASPTTNGIISGNGGGLTNLPPVAISGTPDYSFQSTLSSFEPPYNPSVNYFVPEGTEVAVPIACGITCDFAGKVPGIYFWKTRSTIQFQYLWNSASGMILWDGNRIYGEMSWAAHQATLTEALGILDPEYTLTRTVSPVLTNPLDNPTAMVVVMESTNTSITAASDYFVDFYRIGAFTAQVPAPLAPTGFAVSRVTGYDASITWVCPGATQYSSVLTPPGDIPNPQTTTTVRLIQSNLTPSTTYSIVVTGANSGGSSPASAPFSFATNGLPSIVTGLVVSAITSTGFTLNFNPSQTPAGTESTLAYAPLLTPSDGSVTPGTNSFVFEGLSPSTYYVVTVTSVNVNGNGYASAPAFIKTSAAPPPA